MLRHRMNIVLLTALIAGMAGAFFSGEADAQIREKIEQIRKSNRVHAPDFPRTFKWLNTDTALSRKKLRGKIVLIDFWTYACINCLHVIPDLRYIEDKYKDDPVVVLGVHSAKFTNEQDTENIRQAILRYNIPHPVVVDRNYTIWKSFGVRAWPTMVLVDPEGIIIGIFSGEGNREIIDEYISTALDIYGREGKLDNTPIVHPRETRMVDSPLNYPGKIIADAENGLLFIADSNNNRIVVTDPGGTIIHLVGSGDAALRDGEFESASFNHPQGMALSRGKLLVADTGNHAIREVNFATRRVTTLAGTGVQGGRISLKSDARTTPLNSPWGIYAQDNFLYIAMAGPHQISRLDLATATIEPFAGSGREARRDGVGTEAAFAQPSGLTGNGTYLYVADSEISSIRSILLVKNPRVRTVAGGDLFEFGDVDGRGDAVRLQHPLGVYYYEGKVYIADTFNHKIKVLDPEKRTVETFAGTGEKGYRDGRKAQFYEPSGLTVLRGRLYVADTNNHRIRTVELKSGEVGTLNIHMGNAERKTGDLYVPGALSALYPSTVQEILPVQTLAPETEHTLDVTIDLPEGTKFNDGSPIEYAFGVDGLTLSSMMANRMQSSRDIKSAYSFSFRTHAPDGRGSFTFELVYFYCETENTALCRVRSVFYTVPYTVQAGGKRGVVIADRPGM